MWVVCISFRGQAWSVNWSGIRPIPITRNTFMLNTYVWKYYEYLSKFIVVDFAFRTSPMDYLTELWTVLAPIGYSTVSLSTSATQFLRGRNLSIVTTQNMGRNSLLQIPKSNHFLQHSNLNRNRSLTLTLKPYLKPWTPRLFRTMNLKMDCF